jgi:predicted alpha/beta-hydrolase family hydrolase
MAAASHHAQLSGPEDGPLLIFAHGAGAGMSHAFMVDLTERLNERHIGVLRFNFPYMQRMEDEGKRRPPNPMPMLQAHFKHVLLDQVTTQVKDRPVYIGGKSMGGRVASLIADDVDGIQGLVLLGFPFHPVGKPERYRGAHLASIQTPTLILQGERDTLGHRDEVASFALGENVSCCWLPDGDHGIKPRKASGLTLEDNLDSAADAIAAFIHRS